MISWTDLSYTLEQHFSRIGERFDNAIDFQESGYAVELPQSKVDLILSDPNVCVVAQNAYGKFC